MKSLSRYCVSNTLGFRKECDQEIPFIGRCRYKKQEMVAGFARVTMVNRWGGLRPDLGCCVKSECRVFADVVTGRDERRLDLANHSKECIFKTFFIGKQML